MFKRNRKPAQTPVHPLNQFATVLTAEQWGQYIALGPTAKDRARRMLGQED